MAAPLTVMSGHIAYLEYTALARLFAIREATTLVKSQAHADQLEDVLRFICELHSIYSAETRALLPIHRAAIYDNEQRIDELLRYGAMFHDTST